jgi:hypothetical protein
MVSCYLDVDGDGHGTAAGALDPMCVCPAGSVQSADDCDDGDPARFAAQAGAPDQDGDGHCTSAPAMLCTGGGLPPGYVADCPAGTSDTCDDNAAGWVRHDVYADADADGHCSSGAVTLCNDGSIPFGYASSCWAGTRDVCDANPSGFIMVTVYRDYVGDGPGVNATASAFCTDGNPPSGYQWGCPYGTVDDCDNDSARWLRMYLYRDEDQDGACLGTVPTPFGTNGSALPGYSASCPRGNSDCNDRDGNGWAPATCYIDYRDGWCGNQVTALAPTAHAATIRGPRAAARATAATRTLRQRVLPRMANGPSAGHCCTIGCPQPNYMNIPRSAQAPHRELPPGASAAEGPIAADILDDHRALTHPLALEADREPRRHVRRPVTGIASLARPCGTKRARGGAGGTRRAQDLDQHSSASWRPRCEADEQAPGSPPPPRDPRFTPWLTRTEVGSPGAPALASRPSILGLGPGGRYP